MALWTISDDRRALLSGGQPAFLLADTLWAAFGRLTGPEWHAFVAKRREQGFNSVSISILPIAHDQSKSADALSPFKAGNDGRPVLDELNAGYFERAAQMVRRACDAGLTPVLVVLWCNYVPGTWGAKLTPELVLSQTQTDRYIETVVDTFAQFDPIFVLSGDERFDEPVAVRRYIRALEQLKKAAPHCLTSMHSTPDAVLPRAISDHPALDFYIYQSGHDTGWEERASALAEQYLGESVLRPIVDLEPPYEGHGYGAGTGRHTALTVRRASWTAVLAGATAGLGYAAHGVWSWHHSLDEFNGQHFSGAPFPAQIALAFPGADDVALLRRIVEEYDLFALVGVQEILGENRAGVRVGATIGLDRLALYCPHPFKIEIRADLRGSTVRCWNLQDHHRKELVVHSSETLTTVEQPNFLADHLIVFTR